MSVLPHALEPLSLIGLLGLMAWAMASDARTLEIPNRLSLSVAGLFPVWFLAQGMTASVWPYLAIGGAVFLCGFLAFCLRLFGGGDAKLLAALALWAGPDRILPMLALTAVAGALIGLAMFGAELLRQRAGRPAGDLAAGSGSGLGAALMSPIPYGVAIAIGGSYVAAALLAGLA